jgi:hypothetical protein
MSTIAERRPAGLAARTRRKGREVSNERLSLRYGRGLGLAAAAVAALPAHASMFAGEALDKAADILAIVVLVVVPIVAIAVFWIVHVLPEKIAHKRHHPQRDAIQTLCLLSLVFGGLLWPLAWLWAYTKPVAYRSAYGTEKHEDYFHEMAEKFRAGTLSGAEIAHLRDELDAMAAVGALSPLLRTLRDDLDRPPPAAAAPAAKPAEGKA